MDRQMEMDACPFTSAHIQRTFSFLQTWKGWIRRTQVHPPIEIAWLSFSSIARRRTNQNGYRCHKRDRCLILIQLSKVSVYRSLWFKPAIAGTSQDLPPPTGSPLAAEALALSENNAAALLLIVGTTACWLGHIQVNGAAFQMPHNRSQCIWMQCVSAGSKG